MLQTVDPIAEEYSTALRTFELICVTVFTVEYIARIWSITSSEKYRHPVTGRFRYALTPYLLVDLLAILPFYIGGVVDLRFIRILRIFRIFRTLKVARYSQSIQTITTVIRNKKTDLLISITLTSTLLVLTSSMMYYVERSSNPEAFSSIPETLWWGIITLTTVGYGDVVPTTPLGQLLAGLSAFLGIGLFSLPTSILASEFIEEATSDEDEPQTEGEEKVIRLSEDVYKEHNSRRQELGLTWSEYIDKRANFEQSMRDVLREELENNTSEE
ncbi:MAG: ion transport protein [halophilic archaeon J07HX64]|jgi:Ion transport protein.|nr:MAG: ion transport protein [halophilic archaeon J07HX64]